MRTNERIKRRILNKKFWFFACFKLKEVKVNFLHVFGQVNYVSKKKSVFGRFLSFESKFNDELSYFGIFEVLFEYSLFFQV